MTSPRHQTGTRIVQDHRNPALPTAMEDRGWGGEQEAVPHIPGGQPDQHGQLRNGNSEPWPAH